MNLDGTWKPSAVTLNGEDFVVAALQSVQLVIIGDNFTSVVNNQTDKGKIKLDTNQKFMAMDFVSTYGPNIGKVIPAIFKIEKGELVICYNLQMGSRPKEFVSTAQNKYLLVSYQKVA